MSTNPNPTNRADRRRRKKLVLSGGLAALTLSMFGFGASAAFTSAVNDTQDVDSGTVVLALGADGTAANRLSVDATNIAAGDTIERTVDLVNSGTLDLSSITLTTTATTSSLLDQDVRQGLQLTMDSCSIPWTERGTAPGYTYTCDGVQSALIRSRPVIQAGTALPAAEAAVAGGTTHLRATLVLPAEADNTLQGQTSVIDYEFAGVQRAATNR